MALKERKIAFIGGGHITEIILSNLTGKNQAVAKRLIVSDPVREKGQHLKRAYGVSVARDNLEAVAAGDIIFINVLPDVVGEVVQELKGAGLQSDRLIVTVAAGIPMKTYEDLGSHIPVVRALPNPPSQVGRGIAALAFNPHVTK